MPVGPEAGGPNGADLRPTLEATEVQAGEATRR